MFISQMQIANFRQLHDIQIGPFAAPTELSELIVLAGPNGSGKSSVLELLSFAIAHRYSWQYYQSRNITDHSYAIHIGLTDAEVSELAEQKMDDATLAYAQHHRGYWMLVNMPDALSAEEFQLNERVHGLVSRKFENFTRKLGFFLRADRGYGARGYDRRRLFKWKNKLQPQHFNNISFGATTTQYEDMYDFLVEQSYHYIYELGMYHKNVTSGIGGTPPDDPLKPYNELLGKLFPGYAFVEASAEDLSIKVRLSNGVVLPFQDLSSGEKEVFFILSFFLRNDISDSIIIIDEPELHLHPEFARKLLQTMRTIKPKNQIWCATHSAELIEEAGRERTFYLRMDEERQRAECMPAVNEEAEIRALRDLFGYSGYVGISKKVVFVEGQYSSADRRTFSNVVPDISQEVKIIPVGTSENLYRMNRAVLALLESDFARCQFYLIRDRDFLSETSIRKYQELSPGRLFVLSRYHIENYLLDEHIISDILLDVYGTTLSADEIRSELFHVALGNSAAFFRDMVAFRLGELFQSEDCSIGNHSEGLSLFSTEMELNDRVFEPLKDALVKKVTDVHLEVTDRIDADKQRNIVEGSVQVVADSLDVQNDKWKETFPGRYLLHKFSNKHNLGKWPAFQNLIIDRLAIGTFKVHRDLDAIFRKIAE